MEVKNNTAHRALVETEDNQRFQQLKLGHKKMSEAGRLNDNRKEREHLLQSLSAQFKEPARQKKDSAFTLVANMLNNM